MKAKTKHQKVITNGKKKLNQLHIGNCQYSGLEVVVSFMISTTT